MSFEMQRHDEAARQFMDAERRAADRLAEAEAAARATAHRQHVEAAS
jgi:hypothetical protein